MVYCVSSAPIGSTMKMKPAPVDFPLKKPVLFTKCVKTMEALAWWLGSRKSITMMKAAPKTCHHTEMLLNHANRWLEKMLARETSSKIARK